MPTIVTNVRYATNIEELKRNLQSGIDTIDVMKKSVDRTVQALGGTGLLAAANKTAAAIQQLGGVTKLTAEEQARANAQIEKALEKYRALGIQAPTALKELAAATKQTNDAGGLLASTFGQVLAGFTAANVLSRAVSTLTDMGREALATAGSLVDLSNKTGLSTETLQRMQFVAKQSGSDMGAFADAAFKMGVNIEEGTAKARKGAEALGLSWTDLREASPDAQFNMVVQALERMEDPQKRNEAAVALFGKTAKEILPAIVDGYSKVAEGATVAGDAQVRALDAAGDAWDRFKARMVSGTINAIGNQLLLNEATANLTKGEKDFILQTIEGSKTIEAYNAALIRFYQAKQKAKDIDTSSWFVKPTAAASFVADLKAAEAGYAALTKTQREELFTALQLNKSNDEIIDSLGITADVLAIGKKAYEAHKRAVDEAAASQKKLTQSLEAARVAHVPLTEAQAARVRSLLALTLSEDEAARLAGVHVIQVRQYIAAQKDAAEAEKLLLRVRLDAEKATEKLDAAAADRLHQRTGAIGQGMIEALKVETAARLEAKDLRLKASVDEFTYQQIKLEEWVAAEKAKLAEQVGDHSRAYDAIDELAQEKFAAIARAHDDALEKMRSQELTWGKGFADIIGGVPQLLTQAFTGGGGMSGFAKAFATGGGAMAGGVLGGQLQDVFFSKLAPKMVDGFGATFTQAIGDSIPYIGAAIGALAPVVLGGFKKLFGGVSEEEKKGRETVKAFESQIASTLTTAQKAEAGGESWKMTMIGIRDAYLATGHSAAEAEAATTRLWNSSKGSAEEQKAAQEEILKVMNLQKKAAEALPGILKDVTGGMNAVSQGTVGVLNTTAAALDQTKEGSKEAFIQIRESGREEFDRTGRLAVTAFNAALAGGKSFAEAMEELGPTFDDLTKAQGTFGFTTTESLQNLLNFKAFAAGPGKEVMSTLDGVNQMMSGLSKMGLLTQADFTDLSAIATDTFTKMTAGGVSGDQAMRAMQPTLQKIWELHQDQGLAIDENTAALLTQAEEAGVVGEKLRSPQERMLGVLEAIAKALGADLPEAAEKGAKGVKDAIDKVPKKVGVDFEGTWTPPDTSVGSPARTGESGYAASGGVVTALGIQRFQLGGLAKAWPAMTWAAPRGTDVVPAMLTPGELVLNEPQQSRLAELLGAGAAMAKDLVGAGKQSAVVLQEKFDIAISIQAFDRSGLDEAVEKELMPRIVNEIEDRRRGYTSRLRQALGTT